MDWISVLCIVAVLAGLFAGAAMVARSPTFWVGLGVAVFRAGFPFVAAYVAKRMTPEEEAAWRKAERAGRGEEWLRKRRGAPPKG